MKDWRVDWPEGHAGQFRLERFTITPQQASVSLVRSIMNNGRGCAPAGRYTRLVDAKSGTLWMSDTPDEQRDHMEAVRLASGRMLVTGLGLGMCVQQMLLKPEVLHVTVVELNEDVVELVGRHVKSRFGNRVEIVHGDAFAWVPTCAHKFDGAWHDIWPTISAGDRASHLKIKRKFRRYVLGWQACWLEDEVRRMAAKERKVDRLAAWRTKLAGGGLNDVSRSRN